MIGLYKHFNKKTYATGIDQERSLRDIIEAEDIQNLQASEVFRKYSDALSVLLKKNTLKEISSAYLELEQLIIKSGSELLIEEFEELQKEVCTYFFRAIHGAHKNFEKSILNGVQISIENELFRLTDKVL